MLKRGMRFLMFSLLVLQTLNVFAFESRVVETTINGQRVFLGLTQPNGSLFYFPKGLETLKAKIQEQFAQKLILNQFFLYYQNARTIKLISEQGPAQILPPSLVPPVLEANGIQIAHFMVPSREFSPNTVRDNFENKHESAKTGLYANNALEFLKLMAIYEEVYNLDLFKAIRREISKDLHFVLGKTISDWSLGFAKFEALLYGGSVSQGFVLDVSKSKAIAFIASTLLTTVGSQKLEDVGQLALSHNRTEYLSELNKVTSFALYGDKGLEYNQQNIEAYQKLTSQNNFPGLAEFLKDDLIRETLLNPLNFYDLPKMLSVMGQVDLGFLNDLKKGNDVAIKKLADELAVDESSLIQKSLRQGIQSELWCELALLALKNDPDLAISFQPQGHNILAHATAGKIVFNSDQVQGAAETAATLGHEFWHRYKTSYRDVEIFKYSERKDYVNAVASEEFLAILAGREMRRTILNFKGSIQDDAHTLFSVMNPLKFENWLSILPTTLVYQLTVQNSKTFRSQLWDQWRN